MKNRYANGAHFTKEKFRLLIKYFCMEMTALQIAELLHINRNTANLWINKIRQRIYELVEKEKLKNAKYVQMDETFFTKSTEFFPKVLFPYQEIPVFGIIDNTGKVYAKIIHKVTKKEIFPIVCSCCAKGATIYTDGATVYKGLANMGFVHRYVNHIEHEFSRYEDNICITTNRIEGFWGWMKVRLGKFRGVKWDNLHLHIAESVWRFNHRQDDIYLLLLRNFRNLKL